jgi:tRNA dimethylallyltransferase
VSWPVGFTVVDAVESQVSSLLRMVEHVGSPRIVIGGPTASGKSALALAFAAQRKHTRIVCADSRQVYRGVRIAAAGPTDDELARASHALFGVLDPLDATATAQWFVDACDEEARSHAGPLVIVGGSGLYLRAWRLGLSSRGVNEERRAHWQRALTERGLPALAQELLRRAGDAAQHIDVHNPMRVTRAHEILDDGGSLISTETFLHGSVRREAANAWFVRVERQDLDAVIRRRTEAMFDGGIVEESVALARRLPPAHPLLGMIGTAEALAYARGSLSLHDAIGNVALRTRQYAKRQRTWLRKETWWTPLA